MIQHHTAVPSNEDWLQFGPEQLRAVQGLLAAISSAEPFLAAQAGKMDGAAPAGPLRDLLRWTDLCRDLGVLPKTPA